MSAQNGPDRESALRTLRTTVFILTCAAAAGIAACYLYLAINPKFVLGIPTCTISRLLHIYCPGCGGTRAVRALLTGDLLHALRCNIFVPWFIFCALTQYLRALRALIRRDPYACPIQRWTWISMIVLILLLFVLRNILLIFYGYDYLGDHQAFWAEHFPRA